MSHITISNVLALMDISNIMSSASKVLVDAAKSFASNAVAINRQVLAVVSSDVKDDDIVQPTGLAATNFTPTVVVTDMNMAINNTDQKVTIIDHPNVTSTAYTFGRQGFRRAMEDEAVIVPKFIERLTEFSVYGVFDGHGGGEASKHVKANIEHILREKLRDESKSISCCLIETFESLDNTFQLSRPGTAAVIVLIDHTEARCWTAHVGDSRAIAHDENNKEVVSLTMDHKPNYQQEWNRIRLTRGYVESGRLQGCLLMSRAIGDHHLRPHISCVPDIDERVIGKDIKWILLACDGVFDVMTNQQVADYINEQRKQKDVKGACEALCHHAIDDLWSGDNVTCLLIQVQTTNQAPTWKTTLKTPEIVDPKIMSGWNTLEDEDEEETLPQAVKQEVKTSQTLILCDGTSLTYNTENHSINGNKQEINNQEIQKVKDQPINDQEASRYLILCDGSRLNFNVE